MKDYQIYRIETGSDGWGAMLYIGKFTKRELDIYLDSVSGKYLVINTQTGKGVTKNGNYQN